MNHPVAAKGAAEIARRVRLEQMISRKSDQFAEQAKQLALRLADADLGKTQPRGLESLANATDKVSDITDWLKLRVGRDGRRKGWAKDGVGRDLLSALEGLRSDANQMAAEPGSPEEDLARQLHLQLCREFLRHLAAHFEYAASEKRP